MRLLFQTWLELIAEEQVGLMEEEKQRELPGRIPTPPLRAPLIDTGKRLASVSTREAFACLQFCIQPSCLSSWRCACIPAGH